MAPIKEIIADSYGPPKPKWCYISGPYTLGDPVENTRAMCIEWSRLQRKYPEVVFINPLAMSFSQHFIQPETYDFWIDYDLDLLRVLASSGPGFVYRFRPNDPSSGAESEIALAERLGVPVVYGHIGSYLNERLGKTTGHQHVAGEIEEDEPEDPEEHLCVDPVWLECPNPPGFCCKTCGVFSSHGGAVNPEA